MVREPAKKEYPDCARQDMRDLSPSFPIANNFDILLGIKKDYGPLPNYMLKRMVKRLASVEDKQTIPEKAASKTEAAREKEQKLVHDIRPFPGQTEEGN